MPQPASRASGTAPALFCGARRFEDEKPRAFAQHQTVAGGIKRTARLRGIWMGCHHAGRLQLTQNGMLQWSLSAAHQHRLCFAEQDLLRRQGNRKSRRCARGRKRCAGALELEGLRQCAAQRPKAGIGRERRGKTVPAFRGYNLIMLAKGSTRRADNDTDASRWISSLQPRLSPCLVSRHPGHLDATIRFTKPIQFGQRNVRRGRRANGKAVSRVFFFCLKFMFGRKTLAGNGSPPQRFNGIPRGRKASHAGNDDRIIAKQVPKNGAAHVMVLGSVSYLAGIVPARPEKSGSFGLSNTCPRAANRYLTKAIPEARARPA